MAGSSSAWCSKRNRSSIQRAQNIALRGALCVQRKKEQLGTAPNLLRNRKVETVAVRPCEAPICHSRLLSANVSREHHALYALCNCDGASTLRLPPPQFRRRAPFRIRALLCAHSAPSSVKICKRVCPALRHKARDSVTRHSIYRSQRVEAVAIRNGRALHHAENTAFLLELFDGFERMSSPSISPDTKLLHFRRCPFHFVRE